MNDAGLPENFWDQPDVVRAMTTCDMSTLIDLVRAARGWTQRDLAAILGYSQAWVCRVIAGQHALTIDQVRQIATKLGIPLGALRFEPGGDPTDRRDFLAIAGSAAVARHTPEVTVIPGRRSARGLSPDAVSDLAEVATGYRRAYRSVPASALLSAAEAHLRLTLSVAEDARTDGERRPILAVAGQMADLVGTLVCLDSGRPAEAERYLNLAWQLADVADDPELRAIVLGARSFAAAATGRHRLGLELADLARNIAATGAFPRTHGWVAAVASERCASLGDLAGCQRRLHEASSALASAPDDGPWLGIGSFHPVKLLAYHGGDMARLGRYREAQYILDGAIGRLGLSQGRHRGTALIDRAEARLGAGEVDGACEDAGAALDLVVDAQHVGNFARIDTIARTAAATGTAAGLVLRQNVAIARARNAALTA